MLLVLVCLLQFTADGEGMTRQIELHNQSRNSADACGIGFTKQYLCAFCDEMGPAK